MPLLRSHDNAFDMASCSVGLQAAHKHVPDRNNMANIGKSFFVAVICCIMSVLFIDFCIVLQRVLHIMQNFCYINPPPLHTLHNMQNLPSFFHLKVLHSSAYYAELSCIVSVSTCINCIKTNPLCRTYAELGRAMQV